MIPTLHIQLLGDFHLVGCKAESRHLQEAWHNATGGESVSMTKSPHLVLLTGEAGIGKTRLVEEMEAWVGRQGMTTASARCYAAVGGLAYAPCAPMLSKVVSQPLMLPVSRRSHD